MTGSKVADLSSPIAGLHLEGVVIELDGGGNLTSNSVTSPLSSFEITCPLEIRN
jgi:hypothetical protein